MLCRNARERWLERRQELGLELAVNLVARVDVRGVARDVRIEENRVRDAVAVLAEAADAHEEVQSRRLVRDLERDVARRAVLVARDFLRVDVVDALVLARVAAEREAAADLAEDVDNVVAEVAREDGRLRRFVIRERAGLGREFDDFAGLDDDGALAVRDGDDGAIRDDVVIAVVRAALALVLLALRQERIGVQALADEKFLPLVGEHAADRVDGCFDESHDGCPPLGVGGEKIKVNLALHP